LEIIPAEKVEMIFEKMWNMSEQEAFKLSYVMEKEQPLLLAYLAAVDKDLLNQQEREMLFYLGTVVWQVMAASFSPLSTIGEKHLLACEQANNQLAQSLKSDDARTFAATVKKILKECRQAEVMRYVIAALMDEDSAENTVRDENLGFIILNLKTVIECFDQQTN
jgi:hypothetical protein